MGQEISHSHFSAEEFETFRQRLVKETALLGAWIADGSLRADVSLRWSPLPEDEALEALRDYEHSIPGGVVPIDAIQLSTQADVLGQGGALTYLDLFDLPCLVTLDLPVQIMRDLLLPLLQPAVMLEIIGQITGEDRLGNLVQH